MARDERGQGMLRASGAIMGLLAIGCGAALAQGQPPLVPQLANPASVRCVEKGGALRMERRADGGKYRACVFTDNYQCEEWAKFRGECPAGGLRVTGYITPAARYCAINGGRYTVVANSGTADVQGACALPCGKACEANAYFRASAGDDVIRAHSDRRRPARS